MEKVRFFANEKKKVDNLLEIESYCETDRSKGRIKIRRML